MAVWIFNGFKSSLEDGNGSNWVTAFTYFAAVVQVEQQICSDSTKTNKQNTLSVNFLRNLSRKRKYSLHEIWNADTAFLHSGAEHCFCTLIIIQTEKSIFLFWFDFSFFLIFKNFIYLFLRHTTRKPEQLCFGVTLNTIDFVQR